MSGPLSFIQRLIPFLAKKDEVAMYNRLLKDVDLRGSALDRKIIQLNNRGVDPSSDRWVDLENARKPLSTAYSNLATARYAPGSDREARLLLSTDDAGKQHQASMIHRGVGYHTGERGIPDNGVYIEGLSSEVPGGGTQLFKELEKQFGPLPMYLESVDDLSTLNFYVKKGFVPQPDGSSDVIPHRLFIKPAHVQVKKRGGLVRMAEGGATPLPDHGVRQKEWERGQKALREDAATARDMALLTGTAALPAAGALGRLALGAQLAMEAGDAEAGWTNVVPKLLRKKVEEFIKAFGIDAARANAKELGAVVMPSGQILTPTPPLRSSKKLPSYVMDSTWPTNSVQDTVLLPNYVPAPRGFTIHGAYPRGAKLPMLNHELEHAQATLEGRMPGTNPELFEMAAGATPREADKLYKMTESEVLANSAIEQLSKPWYETQAVTLPVSDFTPVRELFIQGKGRPAYHVVRPADKKCGGLVQIKRNLK